MLLFSTLLPIKDTLTKDAFIQLVIDWNQSSPHEENIIPDIEWHGERNIKFGDEKLWLQIEEYRNANTIAVRYEKNEDDSRVWDTDYIMNFDEMKMSVRLDRSYLEGAVTVDVAFSTPAFIQFLINGGYIEDDDNLPIDNKPLFIKNANAQLLADVINGKAKYRLPVVYISKPYTNKDSVDIWNVAKRLKGVAHVLVQENSRSNSYLRQLTNSKNEYNGAVGIYYPNQAVGHQKYLHHDFPDSEKKLTELVVKKILEYSTSQIIDKLYTWPGVNNELLRDRYSSKRNEIVQLQNNIKTIQQDADHYKKLADEDEALIESVDEEMKSMREQIDMLTKRNDSLYYENQGLREKFQSMSAKPILYLGGEDEFYNREITEWILIALENELKETKPHSRRADVYGDLIRSNGGIQNLAKKRAEKLKNILHGYKRLSTPDKSALEDLGFIITKAGKHYKLRYFDDGRYVATLAVTPSNNFSGGNIASEIINDFF